MDDTITYNYKAIDACVDAMQNKVTLIMGTTDDFTADVRKIMGDWQGETANSYDRLSRDLHQDLVEHSQRLVELKSRLYQAADEMQRQDRKSGDVIAES
ncbi:WXG100 family type VII secretion target [Actinosynnema sp. NPDC050436]|uniref:WXG100 family type VII secretion target n=1 Tax=Actinosynnema sp. NPDC050436 TaxID=3155659 RepID=UPI0033E9807E